MKRWQYGWFFLLLPFLLLAGCNAPQNSVPIPPEVSGPFQSTVSLTGEHVAAQAQFSRLEDGAYTLCLQEPAELEGMCLRFEPGLLTIEYRGLVGSYQSDSVPQNLIGMQLVEAVRMLGQEGAVELALDGDLLKANGQLQNGHGNFEATIHAQTGALASITIPEDDFQATFTEFSYQ